MWMTDAHCSPVYTIQELLSGTVSFSLDVSVHIENKVYDYC